MNLDTIGGLACCRCAGVLESLADALRCRDCGRRYPLWGGVPCLLPDPEQFQIGWHGRLAEYFSMMDAAAHGIAAERERDDLSVRTRERLMRLAGSMQVMRRAIETLMAPVVTGADQLPLPLFPMHRAPGASLSVLHHYENIFRDWAWGEKESERQRILVRNMMPKGVVRRFAIYGAGAGRLAADLHDQLAPAQTFALDINPLPLLVGHELTRGNPVELPEFPVAPRSEEQVAVGHRLRAPRSGQGLTFMLANALIPPFAPESLDVILTPWFIDVVGVELAVTATAINRVLRKGGLWLNVGPLLFKGGISGQHAIGETLDIVTDNGFDVLSNGRDEAPYFQSPHSASWRVETQYWFAASKVNDRSTARGQPTAQPPWLLNPRLPVPPLPQLAEIRQSALFTIGVLSLIDGNSSIADMAAHLARSWDASTVTVENHLRTFFGTFFGDPS